MIENKYYLGGHVYLIKSIYNQIHLLASSFLTKDKEEYIIETSPVFPKWMFHTCNVYKSHFMKACDYPCDYEGLIGPYGEVFYVLHEMISRLALCNSLFLHGCVVEYGGEGYLFTCDSGIGKTTHVSYWKELYGDSVNVINGDIPILQVKDDMVYAYGTPWNGKECRGRQACVALHHIIHLNRGLDNHIVRVNDEAYSLLKPQTFVDTVSEDVIMDNLNRIISKVNVFKMECMNDISAADVASKYIKCVTHK